MPKVRIKVKHPGILEIPEGKKFSTTPIRHFIELAKKKGRGAINRSVTNLKVWNKNKRTPEANAIREHANKIIQAIQKAFPRKRMAHAMVCASIMEVIAKKKEKSPEVKDFFSSYSKVSGKIKGIEKLKGSERTKADSLLKKATESLQQLLEIL